MKTLSKIGGAVLVLGILAAAAVGAEAVASQPEVPGANGFCICPDVYAPVICSNGRVYSNACRASCAHATGCRPYGDI